MFAAVKFPPVEVRELSVQYRTLENPSFLPLTTRSGAEGPFIELS
jgi:hypothetical protein